MLVLNQWKFAEAIMFVTHGMIYVQNSVGRMANTYMETSDNFVDYAFTTTCTYLEKRYFPFEITNTEIVWKCRFHHYQSLTWVGILSLSNVKLLITSLFETGIMQYSTKDVPLLVNGFLKTFPNIFFILPLFIGCTKASVKHITKASTFPVHGIHIPLI